MLLQMDRGGYRKAWRLQKMWHANNRLYRQWRTARLGNKGQAASVPKLQLKKVKFNLQRLLFLYLSAQKIGIYCPPLRLCPTPLCQPKSWCAPVPNREMLRHGRNLYAGFD